MTSGNIVCVQQAITALIAGVVAGSLGVEEFCRQFGILYNRDNDPSGFEPRFRAICEPLFDVVVWYSPFPDERAAIPNYRDESDILAAAQKAFSLFSVTSDSIGSD